MFLALWEFEVKPGSEVSFEKAYGPGGDWARLFCLDPNYIETRLMRDTARSGVYMTLDLWASKESYERFRENHREMYLAIDSLCEDFAVTERNVGSFEQCAKN